MSVGDTVRIVMEPDTEPRALAVPSDLGKALEKSARAGVAFERLSYTHGKELVDWIQGAKKEETRARRIEKAIAMLLKDGQARR